MRKIFLLSALVLLVAGMVMASSFQAIIANPSAITVVNVADADIALIIPENEIAKDVFEVDLQGRVVAHFGSIGPSEYSLHYFNVLEVENNKPYSVDLSCEVLEGDLKEFTGDSGSKPCLWILAWYEPTASPEQPYGPGSCYIALLGPEGLRDSITLDAEGGAHDSAYIVFMFDMPWTASYRIGPVSGKICWYATAPVVT